MGTNVERATELLFPREGGRIRNVKFFPGRCREVTAEQLAEQVLSADEQIRTGRAVRVLNVDGNLSD